jgi:hypothetical protein
LFSDDKNHIPMIFFGILKDITWPISINQIEPCGVEFFDSETRILLRKKFFSTPTPIPKKMKYPPRTPTPKKKVFDFDSDSVGVGVRVGFRSPVQGSTTRSFDVIPLFLYFFFH